MEMEKESNMLTEEEPKYIISLKKRYRILYVVMFVLFLVCTMYFGVILFCAGTDTMIFGVGITVIFLLFLFCSLYGLTKKCERYKGKVVYSFFLAKREYNLSDIAFSNEKIEEFIKIMEMEMQAAVGIRSRLSIINKVKSSLNLA